MEYKEEDFLMLSGVQHFTFCRRQWALIHIEQLWEDNLRTVEGDFMHKKCHDGFSSESRGNIVISREIPIYSRFLGVSGECDVVEFRKSDDGIPIYNREGLYSVYPVEYKHGEPKDTNADILQLVGQAMCLEEMLLCEIDEGAIFYGKTKRREVVKITDDLRGQLKSIIMEMHSYYERGYVPHVKPTKSCNACSLKNLCIPKLFKIESARKYLDENLGARGTKL